MFGKTHRQRFEIMENLNPSLRLRFPKLVFLIFLLLSSLNFKGLSIVFVLLSLVLFTRVRGESPFRGVSKSLLTSFFLLSIPLIIGVVQGILFHNDLYAFFKDGFIFFSLFVLCVFAYILARTVNVTGLYSIISKFGICAAICYVILILIYWQLGWVDNSSAYSFGKTTPPLLYETALAFGFILMGNKSILYRFSVPLLIFLGGVMVFSLERRLILIALISICVFFSTNKWSKLFLILPAFLLVFFIADISLEGNLTRILNLTIQQNILEISATQFYDGKEIRANWRSYETIMAIQKWLEGGWATILLGNGFGAYADLGLELNLAGVVVDEVPVFHNGFVYLLVKVGVIGCLSFLSFLYFVIVRWRSMQKMVTYSDPCFIFNVISLIALTAIAAGLFGHSNTNVLLVLILIRIFGTGGATESQYERALCISK